DPPEEGARLEVRLLDVEPRRGTPSAAQRVVADQPIFRADLFDRLDQPSGNMGCAHFHPTFEGVEPCDRRWEDVVQADALGWLAAVFSDLPGLLDRSGLVDSAEPWVEADAEALREAVPDIRAAVVAVWRSLGIRLPGETEGWSKRLTTLARHVTRR